MKLFEDHSLLLRLESEFKVERAIPVARAALGLMACLESWVEAGNIGRVALCANVCHDVVAAVLGAGCTPIFLDINPINGLVPIEEWARARREGASVALIVHLYGNPSDVFPVRYYFPETTCLIIDDAAQALGAFNSEGLVGGQGDIGLLSFGYSKHISVGGGIVLFKSSAFSEIVQEKLTSYDVIPEKLRSSLVQSFRLSLQNAREGLLVGMGVTGFNGLLDGYTPALKVPFPEVVRESADVGYDAYENIRALRIAKSALWESGLSHTPFISLGMGFGSSPWRYTCRIPGLNWIEQHRIAEQIRAKGLHVSNWYLPTHWMCGYSLESLPGVERLSAEVFQFWIDEKTSLKQIQASTLTIKNLALELKLN